MENNNSAIFTAKETSTMECNPRHLSLANLHIERNTLDENPVYQRESAVWSLDKQQLFIDSLINGYDVPKMYFHDIRGVSKTPKKYAVVDGKQRLHAIFEFFNNRFALATDFDLNKEREYENITGGMTYSEFSQRDRSKFDNTQLDIVELQRANEDDIEELFFRLNNGEPLNAAEKRNARGGKMSSLIRFVAQDPFFTSKLAFANKRYSHGEIAAKYILLELTDNNNGEIFSDLKKKYLDQMVEKNKNMSTAERDGISTRVKNILNILRKIFNDHDPLLAKQASCPLYYIFIKIIHREYGHPRLNTVLRAFLENFQVVRRENLDKPEEERDPALMEFTRLMQQGTNDIDSLKQRVSILTRYFLLAYPDVILKDKKRQFTEEERFVIYVKGGKQCAKCEKKLLDIKEMEADHIKQYAHGGSTALENARCLCIECNQSLKEKIK
jgi:5-methylcytosine-specific restriction endonuclease McrA